MIVFVSAQVQNPPNMDLISLMFETLAEVKLLSYNLSKSSITILGSKKARNKLLEQFKENPSKLNNEPLKIVSQESYLGEEIGINNAESVKLTRDKIGAQNQMEIK